MGGHPGIRDGIQGWIAKTIIEHGYNIICDVAPRVGKTKATLSAMAGNVNNKYLVIYPRNEIKNSWLNDAEKFFLGISFNVDFCNFRSLHKKLLNEYDVIIVDEVHALSDSQLELLMGFKGPICGLSGSLSGETKMRLKSNLRIEHSLHYTIEEAIRDRLIADYRIYLYPVELDDKKRYIDVKGKFKTTEKQNYNYLTKQFEHFKELAYTDPQYQKAKMVFALKRSQAIYKYNSKINKAAEIIRKQKRCLIFTALTNVANRLSPQVYHSKSKPHELQKFKSGIIDKLTVCGMVDMGVTIPNLKTGVFHQLQSSKESAVQRVLRMCNIEDTSRSARIHIVYYENTVDEDWMWNALDIFDKDKIQIMN